MLGTDSSSSLSKLCITQRNRPPLSPKFIKLPYPNVSMLSMLDHLLKSSKFMSPTPWFIPESQSVDGSGRDRSGGL